MALEYPLLKNVNNLNCMKKIHEENLYQQPFKIILHHLITKSYNLIIRVIGNANIITKFEMAYRSKINMQEIYQ